MKIKSAPPPKKSKGMSADDHRKLASKHHARARLHDARADMLDVDNPPKAPTKGANLKIGRY